MKKNKYEGASMAQLKMELAIAIIFAVIIMCVLALGIVMAVRQQQNFERTMETLENGTACILLKFK